jgi:hypothetical protein
VNFYEMSPEVAAASADLYAEASPLFRCPCGFTSASGDEHGRHRSGSKLFRTEIGCQATWVKP